MTEHSTISPSLIANSPAAVELIDFVQAHSCDWSHQPDPGGEQWGIHLQDTPPHNRLLGPVFERGDTCGVLLRKGETVVSWGDTTRADMTFSVTKTYLALTAGVAFDRGLIQDLDEPVAASVRGIGFDDAHNRLVTWRHLLHFTSEWEGSCFGVPDQVDRYRAVGMHPVAELGNKGDARPLRAPGTYWEYNDVRINQFALALMHLFKQPLPDVFAEAVMTPLQCSDSWRWHGYDNSWVTIDGRSLQSVPGGGHWGGGMVISVDDQARVARMLLQDGRHAGRQIVSNQWIDLMKTPCQIAPHYGFFTWLNTGHCVSQSVSEHSFFAMGIGGQVIWHDPTRAVVAVLRWIDSEQLEPILVRLQSLLSSG